MKTLSNWILVTVGFSVLIAAGPLSLAAESEGAKKPKRLRDILWVWGNPELAKPGPHTEESFVEASPSQRAKLLGVPNIVMAGSGLPNDDTKAEALTRQVAHARRIVWETTPDGEGVGPPFVYEKRIDQIRGLAKRYPQIEAVLLDDMSTGKLDRGFRAEHARHIRKQLQGTGIQVWGVVYTMSLGREHLAECIRDVDVVNLWMWHAKDTADFEKYVAQVEKEHPEKPIVLGIYLYDYGAGRRMPLDLLRQQCELARRLSHAGRIQGIVLLTIDNDAQAVNHVADWITEFGDETLGKPSDGPARPKGDILDKVPGEWPTWIEGRDGTLLMSYHAGGKLHVARSHDEGRSFRVISTVPGFSPGGYFTRLSGRELIMVTFNEPTKQVAWVSSTDDGCTWSQPTPILTLKEHYYGWGPINVMQDARWAYCLCRELEDKETQALVTWSADGGKTWSTPLILPRPADGNKGSTESTVVQIEPGTYLAAIRGDENEPGTGAFDGFYLSRSKDGLHWSVPESLEERGRMPLFYRIGSVWALAYRQYDYAAKTQHSAVRFSVDGRRWSTPWVLESGVNAGPRLLRMGDRVIAMNQLYPATDTITRHIVVLPEDEPR